MSDLQERMNEKMLDQLAGIFFVILGSIGCFFRVKISEIAIHQHLKLFGIKLEPSAKRIYEIFFLLMGLFFVLIGTFLLFKK